ncbi:MAG: ankyrin repeat domain-containing protein [Planctomycetota bacterium]
MSDSQTPSAPALPVRELPARPNLEHLRNQAKQRLVDVQAIDPAAKLTDAQLDVARSYGFTSWRALKAELDRRCADTQVDTTPNQQAVSATLAGDAERLANILNAHPEALEALGGPWDKPLLHLAAWEGHLAVVELLLERGFDPNLRCTTDNAYAMHFAAEPGHLDVIRALADAGGDVHGDGDDHEMGVLGWATCLGRVQEDVAEFLLERGARLHIFSALALGRADDVRRLVQADPSLLGATMSRNEHFREPLHLAVIKNRPDMVRLLLDLGADPTATDARGAGPLSQLGSGPTDVEIVRMLTEAGTPLDLLGALNAGDYDLAETLVAENPGRIGPDGTDTIALHAAAAHDNADAIRWLADHGVALDAKRKYWGVELTALHACVEPNAQSALAALIEAGADPTVKDGTHNNTPLGWAEYFKRDAIAERLREGR